MLLYTVTLKDGRIALIREFSTEDKEKLVAFYESLSAEALQWGLPPYTREHVENYWLKNLQNMIMLVALHDDRVVGHAQIYKFPNPRRKATGDLLIYVHQVFQNVGLGTAMLTELIRLARQEGLHRVSLRTVADNKLAVHAYEKVRFKVEGVMKDCYFGEDDKYYDELVMGLVFGSLAPPVPA